MPKNTEKIVSRRKKKKKIYREIFKFSKFTVQKNLKKYRENRKTKRKKKKPKKISINLPINTEKFRGKGEKGKKIQSLRMKKAEEQERAFSKRNVEKSVYLVHILFYFHFYFLRFPFSCLSNPGKRKQARRPNF